MKIFLWAILYLCAARSTNAQVESVQGEDPGGADYAKESFFTLNAVAKQSAIYVADSEHVYQSLFDWVAINAAIEADIYGSAIALEPQEAAKYNASLLCPYAYNCSTVEAAESCTVMDLYIAYDYTAEGTDWYLEPRRRYVEEGITDGYWTSPYFDSGAGNVNMVTYSHPIIRNKTFLGVATIDILVEKLCYGSKCAEHVKKVEQIRTVGKGLFGMTVCFGIIGMIWTLAFRQNIIVRVSQAKMLVLIAIGLIISSLSIHFIVHEDIQTYACTLQVWAYSIGFVLTFAPLFSKLWRCHLVFERSTKMKRGGVAEPWIVTGIIPVLVGLDVLILGTWILADGGLQWVPSDDGYSGMCESESAWVFLGLLLALHLGLLFLGLIFAYKTRNISSAFSEASYVALTLIVNLQVMFLGICVVILVSSDRGVRLFVMSAIIFLNNFTTFGLIFLPKMYFHATGTFPHDEGKLGAGIMESHAKKSKTVSMDKERKSTVSNEVQQTSHQPTSVVPING